MSSSSTTVCCGTHAVAASPQSWLDRALAAAERALHASAGWWRPVQAAPEDLDLYSLAYLNDATLRDIGAPDGVRAYAAERREQAELLRQVDNYRDATLGSRW